MTITHSGCVLIDLEGIELTEEEQELLSHPACAGIVLFSRNYINPAQLRQLTADIRKIKPQGLIAVDQEGGRVQRFREGFSILPPMSHWGALYEQDPQSCQRQLTQAVYILSTELRSAGINLNLIPVLDLNYDMNSVIGSRSFHRDADTVTELGRWVINELHRQNFPAVGKHFPGHGWVTLDSHHALPVDQRDWQTLWRHDLRPFTALIHSLDLIMPSHIIYSDMDHRPACFSPFWLQEVLRRRLNFQGVIISDCMSMAAAATRGSYAERATEAYQAGCDLLLVCNNRTGAIDALEALSRFDRRESALRLSAFYSNYAMM